MRLSLLFIIFLFFGAGVFHTHAQGIKLGELRGGYDEEGCYLFYGSSKARYQSQAWIFMSNGYKARVIINGKRYTLKNESGDEDDAFDPDYQVYSNTYYEVVLSTRYLSSDENGERRSGTMTVTNNRSGRSANFSIYGWSGCE